MDERMKAQERALSRKLQMQGNLYKHFKGGLYRVYDVVVHSETAELMVYYVSESDRHKGWVRPLDMFLSPVDREKYPDVKQQMRFERI